MTIDEERDREARVRAMTDDELVAEALDAWRMLEHVTTAAKEAERRWRLAQSHLQTRMNYGDGLDCGEEWALVSEGYVLLVVAGKLVCRPVK